MWHAFIAPRGAPRVAFERIGDEVLKALAQPEVGDRLASLGTEVPPTGPYALGQLNKVEHERCGRLIRKGKIRANWSSRAPARRNGPCGQRPAPRTARGWYAKDRSGLSTQAPSAARRPTGAQSRPEQRQRRRRGHRGRRHDHEVLV